MGLSWKIERLRSKFNKSEAIDHGDTSLASGYVAEKSNSKL